jgi:hypothetical protein
MAWAALIPAAISAVQAISQAGKGSDQGGGGAAAGPSQPMQPILPPNPFPANYPDGGKKTPSILDLMGNMQGAAAGPAGGQPQQQDEQGNFMVPGGGKPLSIVDAFLPGGTSPSIFNPIQDPLQAGLGGLIKGIFK